jgi:glyoxylase-like metal-dependent hydrolase (beta-lactamase superfamily II)
MAQIARHSGRAALIVAAIGLAALALTVPTRAQSVASLETLPVHGQVSLVGSVDSTNVAVQVGSQGVLVVDTLAEPMADSLVGAIRALAGNKPIRYVVNTSADLDHVGGNLKVASAGAQLVGGNFAAQLGAAGSQSAFIVAHENVLNRLSAPTGGQPAIPFGGWPTDTFFQNEKTMYFNGEGIELLHEPAAHSDGDILVFFRSSDVIAAGEVFVTTAFPRIDVSRGGSVNGVVESLNRIIDLAISEQFTEGGTRIIPGRGRITDEFDVVEYRDMMTIVRDRVQAMIKKGMTLEQVQAARPAFDWEPRYGASSGRWTTAMFVEAVFRSLAPASRVSQRQ